MKFIFVFSALFLTIASQNANSIDVGSGDMVSSPAIHVTATLEDDVLSVTVSFKRLGETILMKFQTSWTILRDNNCDVYRKQEKRSDHYKEFVFAKS